MKLTILLVLVIVIISLPAKQIYPQVEEKPITVNPLIGDTLDVVEQNYYMLFPSMEGFQSAVFYLNQDSTLNAEVHYLNNGISTDTLIHNYKNLKSLNYHINARKALENKSYVRTYEDKKTKFDKGANVSVYIDDGDMVSGELLSVRRNSLLILKQELHSNIIKPECIDKINRTEINEVLIKGNSNLGWGVGLGILASVIAGAIIYSSNYKKSDDTKFWGIDFSHMRVYDKSITPIIISSISLITLGTAIGILTSTPDVVIKPYDKYEYLYLQKYARYQFNEPNELKSIK